MLNDALIGLELKVEFYSMGGAVISQAFHASPPTAHVSAFFRPDDLVGEAVTNVAEREAWPPDWLPEAVRTLLGGHARRDRFLELSNLAVFVPQPEYVLALKIGALRLGTGARALDDLRYALRALNVTRTEDALSVAGRYFSKRQIPPQAREALEALLGS
jgi:hypothetical protein